ncbi:MAG: formate dehydrogenase subunit alpha [Fimbriimonadaceae bacterium]|nr:formate dehydrogenase subunit alpha [Fimbriimonadaceae bacterium]
MRVIPVKVDGRRIEVPDGTTVLAALRSIGLDVPTACDDPRIAPLGACRLCLVGIAGQPKPASACSLRVQPDMEVEVDRPDLHEMRRDALAMLARGYPREYVAAYPEKTFHRWLLAYGIEPTGRPGETDATNPYFRFDPSACIACFRCVRVCDEVQGSHVWTVVERGSETRVVPDGDSLRTSGCKSCGACVDACPTAALVDKTRELGRPDAWTRTTCPYCGVGCELSVGTKGGRVHQILPVPDALVNHGHLCVKGRYAHAFVHSEDRVGKPLIRRNGRLEEATWPEAIERVAEGMKRILTESGPDAIGVLGSARATNEDNYLIQKFARVVLGTNNVDCCARVCHGPTAAAMKAMIGTGAATNSYVDLADARGVLVIGCNPTENHPVIGSRILRVVREGAKLVVVDPRKTELARMADVHVPLRPGTNIPFLNAMAHTILAEGLADRSFLAERVDGLEPFAAFVQAWSPERAGLVCGVEPETIRAAARLYATSGPFMAFHGLGMTEHLQGTEGVMALVNLALLTGNLGKPGAGINPLRGQNNVQGSAHMGCEPSNLTGFVSPSEGRERFEVVWNAPVPQTKGLNMVQMLQAAGEGRLRALWAVGYDVYLTQATAAATRASLSALDLVVVQDLFLNETAREFAHVFLPACSSFERDGTFMNAERRVQRVRKAIDPIGESKGDWEIVQSVARAMGHREGFSFGSVREIWDEIRQVWTPGAGMSYDRLEVAGLQWPCPTEDHPGTRILHREKFPIGVRAALRPIEYTPTTETVDPDFPFLLNSGRTLYQFNAGTMTDRTPNHELRPTDTLEIHPDDAKRLGLSNGDRVRVVSRYGEATLPVQLDRGVRIGELFATFHSPKVFLNNLTSPVRDRTVGTPEYKVTAVRLEQA